MSRGLAKSKDGARTQPCDRREAILDAATRLFAEHGFSDAVTQLIADELGVGKGTIYRYFPSKRELFLAAADRVMRQLQERLAAASDEAADPLERIGRAIRAYLAFFDDHPEYVELLVQERAQFKDRDKPTYFEHRERTVERWREVYRGLIAEGRVRPIVAERISDVVASMLFGAICLNYFSGRTGSFKTGPEEMLDILFHGILSEPERRRGAAGAGGGVVSGEGDGGS